MTLDIQSYFTFYSMEKDRAITHLLFEKNAQRNGHKSKETYFHIEKAFHEIKFQKQIENASSSIYVFVSNHCQQNILS